MSQGEQRICRNYVAGLPCAWPCRKYGHIHPKCEYPGCKHPRGHMTVDCPEQRPEQRLEQKTRKKKPQNKSRDLYKTETCRNWERFKHCKYGEKCQFAHGEQELRKRDMGPNFKIRPCKNYERDGVCPYGHRCHFIHRDRDNEDGSMGGSKLLRLLNINPVKSSQ